MLKKYADCSVIFLSFGKKCKEIWSQCRFKDSLECETHTESKNMCLRAQVWVCYDLEKQWAFRPHTFKLISISANVSHSWKQTEQLLLYLTDGPLSSLCTLQGMKGHKCDVCSREFTLSANLKRHMLIHNSVRPFQCHVCFKSFIQKQTLKTHMIVHLPVKPFKCKVRILTPDW